MHILIVIPLLTRDIPCRTGLLTLSLTQPIWLHPAGAGDEVELAEEVAVREELATDDKEEVVVLRNSELVMLGLGGEGKELVALEE